MKWAAWFLLLALACCSRPAPSPPVSEAAAPAVCRIGPNGGRPVADRGIGGTGAPTIDTVDRGIGGTGIIGVITGFASVCVAGEEVSLPSDVSARIDEDPAQLDDLRAGQVVAIEAAGQSGALQARRIVVRHVVIGPVQAIGPGTMTVAGQLVSLAGATGSAIAAKPGQWVAVSGWDTGGAMIAATRIDPAPTGRVLVRGELVRIYATARIGSLPVQLPPGSNLPAGFPVTVTGRLQGGVLIADSATMDVAAESPSAYFGPSVNNFIIEGAVAVLAGGYLINRDFVSGSGFGRAGSRDHAVARFTRGPDGLVATGLRLDGAPAGGARFTPAPVVPGASGDRSGGLGGSGFGRGFGGAGVGSPGFGPGPAGSAGGFAPLGSAGLGGAVSTAGPALPGRH